ncbi:GTPase ObgE [Candidatus Kaiserbacteria bacterium]|nr:GTPase ObgE [Candidatus Kaiserbacteria bacterium]
MFVDELTIHARAGKGGDGVERWRHEKRMPLGGPAGGNGGKGGDVYVRAVRNINVLAKYTGAKEFRAQDGKPGESSSRHGRGGEDLTIDIPVGTAITRADTGKTYELIEEGETRCILRGGNGGLGNEIFKSSTNRSPTQTTKGKPGEESILHFVLSLIVDVGIIGLPNAGKSTLLNALTNARSRIGAYPFTTLEPELGDLFGFILADIPGLIEGAAEGKGLGHKFLRHIQKTKMLLHCVALTDDDPRRSYETIRRELAVFDPTLTDRPEWIVLTKTDSVPQKHVLETMSLFRNKKVFAISQADAASIKRLSDALVGYLRSL